MTHDAAPLWSLDELVNAVSGRLEGRPGPIVSGISIDSRTVGANDAFFAIRGERFDGHDFVPAALGAGAAVAVVSEARAAEFARLDGARLVVPDVLSALGDLGRAARARMSGTVVAVTGSVGKTGTKEALRLALAPSGPVHAAEKSFNNHWGVPLTLARMPRESRFGVFEIGMNHPGEIRPLVGMVRPHVAIITTVAAVHLGYFGSVEEIARAKAEIFEGVEHGGAVLLNSDNEHFALLAGLARDVPAIDRIFTFGQAPSADIRLRKVILEPERSLVTAFVFGKEVRYVVGAPGAHLVANSLAVLGAAELAGADLAAACAALAAMSAPVGRGRRHRLVVGSGEATLIDESYNANPVSMRAALALLGNSRPGRHGRRVAVLGDMLELGEGSAEYHAGLAEAIEENAVDRVYCCGPMMRALWERLPESRQGQYAAASPGLSQALVEAVSAGDVIMVKGSLGSRMGPLVETLLSTYGADKSAGESF